MEYLSQLEQEAEDEDDQDDQENLDWEDADDEDVERAAQLAQEQFGDMDEEDPDEEDEEVVLQTKRKGNIWYCLRMMGGHSTKRSGVDWEEEQKEEDNHQGPNPGGDRW